MLRRHFLRQTLRLPLTMAGLALVQLIPPGKNALAHPPLPGSNTTTPEPSAAVTLLETPVAGWHYYDGDRIWNTIRPGDPLELHREPANPHDHRAIAVYRKGAKLGYIPRNNNTVIAHLLDQQAPVTAQVQTKHPGADPWKRVVIRVVMGG